MVYAVEGLGQVSSTLTLSGCLVLVHCCIYETAYSGLSTVYKPTLIWNLQDLMTM
jgi:hypothetical protein